MFNLFKKPFKIDDFAKLVITEARKVGIAESLECNPRSFVSRAKRSAHELGHSVPRLLSG
jgi:hypothetical protein